jgi:hypothetical protein
MLLDRHAGWIPTRGNLPLSRSRPSAWKKRELWFFSRKCRSNTRTAYLACFRLDPAWSKSALLFPCLLLCLYFHCNSGCHLNAMGRRRLYALRSDYCSLEFFKHEPLDTASRTIRLVKILPRRRYWDPIECTVEHVSLTQNQYVCLSYMWGDAGSTSEILLNGQRMIVRQNLWDFLDNISSSSKRRLKSTYRLPFWIDALCIDQQNHVERGHQVQLMSDIYSQAAWVLVWPGIMKRSINLVMKLDWCFRYHDEFLGVDRKLWLKLFRLLFPGHWEAPTCLNQAPYWRRLWIIQEIRLNSRVLVLTKRHLSRLQHSFPRNCLNGLEPAIVNTVRGMTAVPKAERVDWMLSYTTEEESECTDWHDRAYAIKSLCPALRDLPVDYGYSRTQLAASVVWETWRSGNEARDPITLLDLLGSVSRAFRVQITYRCRGAPQSSWTLKRVTPRMRQIYISDDGELRYPDHRNTELVRSLLHWPGERALLMEGMGEEDRAQVDMLHRHVAKLELKVTLSEEKEPKSVDAWSFERISRVLSEQLCPICVTNRDSFLQKRGIRPPRSEGAGDVMYL